MNEPVVFLFVDDEEHILRALSRCLKSRADRIEALCVTSAERALKILETRHVDVVVADYRMPDVDGLAFLRDLKRERPSIVRMIMSASLTGATRRAIEELGVAHVVEKPWQGTELISLLEAVAADVCQRRDRRSTD